MADDYKVILTDKDKTTSTKEWGADQAGAWNDYEAKSVAPNLAVVYEHWIDLPTTPGQKVIADAWAWTLDGKSEQMSSPDAPATAGAVDEYEAYYPWIYAAVAIGLAAFVIYLLFFGANPIVNRIQAKVV